MKRDVCLFVEDILERINLIEDSTKDISKLKFKMDKVLVDATIRRLEIIGEAAKNIPNYFREKYGGVPWRDISGFRDVLVHVYFGVNLDKIWAVIRDDLPKLKRDIEEILEKEKINDDL